MKNILTVILAATVLTGCDGCIVVWTVRDIFLVSMLSVMAIAVGLIFLYGIISNWWNKRKQRFSSEERDTSSRRKL